MTTLPHTSTEFEAELDALGEQLVAMGTRSEDQLSRATRALADRDDRGAADVIASDALINQNEKDIDEQALRLLARWQPVARDLRFITMTLKAVIHLERIGDLAVGCARCAQELNRTAPPTWRFDVEPLALTVQRALHAVLAAVDRQDAEAARRVLDNAAEADRLHAKLLAQMLARIATNPATITSILPLTTVCRYLGHVADHVKSLASEIIYMVDAEHVHHAAM